MNPMRPSTFLKRLSLIAALVALTSLLAQAAGSFTGSLNTVTRINSTGPADGGVNPYRIAGVPPRTGTLVQGHILVSNFNNSTNLQGTGTTIMDLAPDGTVKVFAHITAATLPGPCPGGVGLTTALVVLRSGWVIVGSLPTSDGTAATALAGCLIVLDSNGNVAETITDAQINGPWDMTAFDETGNDGHVSRASLFVTNVLNGTVAAGGSIVNEGTVLRVVLDVSPSGGAPSMESLTVIGSGFSERTDPAALVIGPTGVTLGKNNKTLYVADSLNHRIAAIGDPLHRSSSDNTGSTLSSGGSLNDPSGMALAINGNILTANGNDGNLVETPPMGIQAATPLLDGTGNPAGAGTLFGLTDVPGHGLFFVDDGSNTLNLEVSGKK